MSLIMVFWSDRKIKMPRNVVFTLNRETKMPPIQKLLKNPRNKNTAKI